MTRREALALGAAAGVTATVGDPASVLASTTVGGTGASGPAYLRRSGYADCVGHRFTVGGEMLTLVAVEDVARAVDDADLRGHDAAFCLRFDGAADALPSALHEVRHDLLGPFPLFLGPTGATRGLKQEYTAVIDRTVRVTLPRGPEAELRPPAAAPPPSAAPDEPGRDEGPAAEKPSEPTARDLEIVEEREAAARAPRIRRRRRTRRARHRLRRTHAERAAFVRKRRTAARKRARKIRAGWLRRHQP